MSSANIDTTVCRTNRCACGRGIGFEIRCVRFRKSLAIWSAAVRDTASRSLLNCGLRSIGKRKLKAVYRFAKSPS